MKRFIYLFVFMIGAFIAYTPDVFAHDIGRRVRVVHDGYVRGIHHPVWPHWLRAQHDFQRWYLQSHYRHLRHPGWHRLYQLYRQDVQIHRHHRPRIHHRHRHGCRHH